jgi:hypothetical protein
MHEAVRQAIQNKASYNRVMILFILLVFSFSLLFLDWYNYAVVDRSSKTPRTK